ncbi:hypothetical protein [Tenacibaculum amylolyticum]|uniref:hypothetical protein n=1 Tax=Tenacibaculum amylolyticum TaxID=104269 RepID=UPI0038933135
MKKVACIAVCFIAVLLSSCTDSNEKLININDSNLQNTDKVDSTNPNGSGQGQDDNNEEE